jgi:hypothetical protein
MDYHILEQAQDGKTMRVVFHFPVPAQAKNAADILYSDIVQKCCDLTSQLPNFETEYPTEYASLQSGTLIERLVVVQFSSINLTPAQKRAEIEAAYEPERVAEFARLQIEWEWYGYAADIE